MRENRLAKLAGLKKMALRDGTRKTANTVATPSLEPNTETAYETAYKTEFENNDSLKIYEKIKVDIRELSTKKKSLKGGGEVFFIEAAGYYLGRLGETEKSILNGLKTALGSGTWYGQKIPTNTLRELLDYEEAGLYNKFITALNLGSTEGTGESASEPEASSKNKDTSAGRSRSVSPEATRGSSDATAVINKDLWGKTASDSNYKYIISGDGKAFQWSSATAIGDHKQGDKNWSVMVGRINQLTGIDRAIPTAATPASAAATNPATTPAVTPAVTTETATTTQANPELVSKIKEVLKRAKKEPLDIKSLGNEMLQIKQLDTSISSRGIDGLGSLAALVASRVGNLLPNLERATVVQIQGARRKVLAANGRGFLSMDVNTILDSINDIYGEYNRAPSLFLNRYFTKPAAPATTPTAAPATAAAATAPAATTAATAATATDASLNKKFIKAATLRRLKIRSQMEAAIDSSAQMGRARVS